MLLTVAQLQEMRAKAVTLIEACKQAFGARPFAKMIKPHMCLHASDQYEYNGPIKDGAGADQQAEAMQAEIKGAADRTNYHDVMEGQMGRLFHRLEGAPRSFPIAIT